MIVFGGPFFLDFWRRLKKTFAYLVYQNSNNTLVFGVLFSVCLLLPKWR